MSSARLAKYGGNLKRIAAANARDDQFQVIRNSSFKANLVGDPLQSSPDIVTAIENSRKPDRK